jgi:hypothetical protein
LGLLKREAERQRLLREDIEMESQKLNNHIFVTQSALEESNTRNAEELKDTLSALKETERCPEFPYSFNSSLSMTCKSSALSMCSRLTFRFMFCFRKVEEKESEILHLRRKLENLEIVCKDKDVQV